MGTKIGVISGFLGAGKTTLIKKFLDETLKNEATVLIENEFGEIGIDGRILKQTGVRVREINSGCICCTLAGDFRSTLKDVLRKHKPDRVLIEPSGVGELSEILPVCRKAALREGGEVSFCITVVDAMKYRMYSKNFSEFFYNQIENAGTVLLSRTQKASDQQLADAVKNIREHNPKAPVVTTPLEQIKADELLSIAEKGAPSLISQEELEDGEHHHHHDAHDSFEVWSVETTRLFEPEKLDAALRALPQHGEVLRAKGILPIKNGAWCRFDYVPDEISQSETEPDFTGRLCVIGKGLDKAGLAGLFQV